ncbi:MAG TPA: SDR family oxidoreductase [Xanthobacteraceae bacterium]|nr:SDR family oxidoreductase [Xanthobacteraceae bacterium]
MGRLRDKVILITGAAGGIGSAIAEAVVRNGGLAVATDIAGRTGMDYALDVTAEADWQRVIDAVGSAGRLDGLVNAAGIVAIGTVEETDFATWRRIMAVNLDGTFLGCKYAMPLLRKAGGSIVNISSVSGIVGGHNLAAYNASKGGVRLLTKSVALSGARNKPPVRCNSVHPTFIEGPMTGALLSSVPKPEETRAKMERSIPLNRFGQPSEVAEMCVYLLSEESGFVTGAEFAIDGGLTAQ